MSYFVWGLAVQHYTVCVMQESENMGVAVFTPTAFSLLLVCTHLFFTTDLVIMCDNNTE